MGKNWVFLGHEELSEIRELRQHGEFEAAKSILLRGEPSAAVLDELRKVASEQARLARASGDWNGVVKALEEYTAYAKQWRKYCIEMVNQEPPSHSKRDLKLLEQAKQKIAVS